MTRELSIYKWERRHSSLLKRRHLADRNRTHAFPTHTNVTFFFFLALMLSYLRWPMKIRLNLILDGGKHRAAPQRKQMIILLTLWMIPYQEWYHSSRFREGFIFKVVRISQACSAVSDKWHFACSGPPFLIIKKLHQIKSKDGFVMQINKVDMSEGTSKCWCNIVKKEKLIENWSHQIQNCRIQLPKKKKKSRNWNEVLRI